MNLFKKKINIYIAIFLFTILFLLIYFINLKNDNYLNYSHKEEPDFLKILNESKREKDITKAISFDFQDCHLTWLEEWQWPEDKLCVADHQAVKSAFSINLSMVDGDTGIKTTEVINSNSSLVDISPEISLGFEPTPEFENTDVEVKSAKEVFDLLSSKKNALKTYHQMCRLKTRISYSKSLLIFTKRNMSEKLSNTIKYYANKC